MTRRLNMWDGLAALFIAALAVPYIGYLVRGSMPFIHDARGMAATGLVLGGAAFLAMLEAMRPARLDRFQVATVVGTLIMGLVAVGLAETFAAGLILAIFMAMVLVTWLLELSDHIGMVRASHEDMHHGGAAT